MSANFLDTSGSCTGIDLHMYFGLGPAGVPFPMPFTMHVVYWKHSWPSRDWRIATTVTTRGNPVLQSNWAMMYVVHYPTFPMAPHAIEIVQIAGIIAAGSAAPQLTAHKVTGQGSALCTEISGSEGLNLDCSDLISLSRDLNPNTVMTQPTRGDYVAAIFSAAFSALYSYGVNQVIGKFFPTEIAKDIEKKALEVILQNIAKAATASLAVAVVQNLLDLLNSKSPDGSWKGDVPAIAISKASTKVQQLVDGE